MNWASVWYYVECGAGEFNTRFYRVRLKSALMAWSLWRWKLPLLERLQHEDSFISSRLDAPQKKIDWSTSFYETIFMSPFILYHLSKYLKYMAFVTSVCQRIRFVICIILFFLIDFYEISPLLYLLLLTCLFVCSMSDCMLSMLSSSLFLYTTQV